MTVRRKDTGEVVKIVMKVTEVVNFEKTSE